VPRFAVSTTALLHLGLEHVPLSVLESVSDTLFLRAKNRPVVVIELLDDLECPATGDDVATHQLVLESSRVFPVAAGPELVGGLTEQTVGVSDQLMHVVQMPPRALDTLERLGQFPHGSDGVVIDVSGPEMLRAGPIGFGHVSLYGRGRFRSNRPGRNAAQQHRRRVENQFAIEGESIVEQVSPVRSSSAVHRDERPGETGVDDDHRSLQRQRFVRVDEDAMSAVCSPVFVRVMTGTDVRGAVRVR